MNASKFTSIKATEDSLFSDWRNQLKLQNNLFIPDGIVNEEKWSMANTKALFLLKEVNAENDTEEWDERDYLNRYNTEPRYIKTHSPTITSLTEWIHAIHSKDNLKWSDVVKQTRNTEVQSELLKQIALVNLKKVPGGGTIDYRKFDTYWKNTKNIQNLKEQLNIYLDSENHPDFIICGATSWAYKEIFKDSCLCWKETKRGISFCKHNNTIVIDYCHPQARISSNIKYYALFDAIKEIKELF